jgi:hypothetical protein
MKKLLLAMSAIPALAIAMPVAAQVNVYNDTSVGIQHRLVNLDSRIDAGLRAGTITQSEARALRIELRQLARLERRYSRNGLTVDERRDLQMRLRDLRQDIRLADGRGNRWDDDDYYGQGGPIDAEADGWVIDDDCESRSRGIGGILSSVLGGNNCLRVGQRVTGSMYAVPYQYRDTFRDSSSVYFRSDGRSRVYEIDARTNTVLRVWTRGDNYND